MPSMCPCINHPFHRDTTCGDPPSPSPGFALLALLLGLLQDSIAEGPEPQTWDCAELSSDPFPFSPGEETLGPKGTVAWL